MEHNHSIKVESKITDKIWKAIIIGIITFSIPSFYIYIVYPKIIKPLINTPMNQTHLLIYSLALALIFLIPQFILLGKTLKEYKEKKQENGE